MDLAQLQPKLFADFQAIIQADRLSHAYLFSGDFASFELAIYLAQSLFCQEKVDRLPCGTCRTCRLIAEQDFADLKVIEPSGQVIKTETVRALLREFSSSGFEQEAQVFIIRQADKMHINAANSLLKYIEEPQSNSYMILLTEDDNKVLPTIKSRTQIFHFAKNQGYLSHFFEQEGLLKSQAAILADLAKDPQDAKKIASQKKILDLLASCQSFANSLLTGQAQAYLQVASLAQQAGDKKEQDLVFQLLTLVLAKDLTKELTPAYLDKLAQARKMWLSNVSFQNALEYMVIT